MPVITIRIAKGRPVGTKRALAAAMTTTIVETLDIKPEWVMVLIEEFDRENWATGGLLHLDKLGTGHSKAGTSDA